MARDIRTMERVKIIFDGTGGELVTVWDDISGDGDGVGRYGRGW